MLATGTIFIAGTELEVQHHAAPLFEHLHIEIAECSTILQKAQPGDLVVFFTEHFDRFRNAIQQLKQNRIATLYAIDGILEWRNAWENADDEPACPWTMRPILSHKVACIGASQARVVEGWGNQNKTELVGVPRFDRLFAGRAELNDLKGNQKTSTCPRILVTTAKCPGFTQAQRNLVRQSLNDVKLFFEKKYAGQVELTWRLTGDFATQIGVRNTLGETTGKELVDLLAQMDAVITTPSTVQLESMILDIPTANLDYTNSPAYVDSAWRISHSDQIEKTVHELLYPPEPKLHYQRMLLADAVECDGKATERMVQLIRGMLDISAEHVAAGTDLEFPASLIELKRTQSPSRLNHATCFPEHPAFRNDDLLALQAELGHSRREIEHLNRQIDSLKNELQEAHQIFDQINKHPIAGPVVRTRQKLINWMTHFRQKNVEVESVNSPQ